MSLVLLDLQGNPTTVVDAGTRMYFSSKVMAMAENPAKTAGRLLRDAGYDSSMVKTIKSVKVERHDPLNPEDTWYEIVFEDGVIPAVPVKKAEVADPFRITPRVLTDQEVGTINAIKEKAGELHTLISNLNHSPFTQQALSSLHIAVMMSTYEITSAKQENML